MTLVTSRALPESRKIATVLVMGDSLSAGYGINPAQGWVSLLGESLKARSLNQPGLWKIANASVSGETSSGGKSRLPELLAKYKPSIVILELGANDGLRGQPLKILENNLQEMITASTGANAQVLLTGMQIPTNYGPRYTRAFKEIFPRLAEKNQLAFVPFLLEGIAGNAALIQPDGLHPTAAAQPIILHNVLPTLLTLLNSNIND